MRWRVAGCCCAAGALLGERACGEHRGTGYQLKWPKKIGIRNPSSAGSARAPAQFLDDAAAYRDDHGTGGRHRGDAPWISLKLKNSRVLVRLHLPPFARRDADRVAVARRDEQGGRRSRALLPMDVRIGLDAPEACGASPWSRIEPGPASDAGCTLGWTGSLQDRLPALAPTLRPQ